MTVLVSLASVLAFLLAFKMLAIPRIAVLSFGTARQAMEAMRDQALNDLERERAVQKASITLLGQFWSMLYRTFLTILAAAGPIYLADILGLNKATTTIGFLSRVDVIVSISILLIVAFWLRGKLWPSR